MKKLFFAALVAIVAVGGAFASQGSNESNSTLANNIRYKATPNSSCIAVECLTTNPGALCSDFTGTYYQLNDTNCTTPISTPAGKRPI